MNPLAIPTAHGHIAPTVWATPRIAALPEGAASARESARGGGSGVGPLRRVRHTEPGFRGVAHLRLSALKASRPGRDDDRMNYQVHQAGGAPPHRLSSAVME